MAKFPKTRERTTGRSVYGDFMDDDLNESVYDALIEASEKLQTVLNMLRDHADQPEDGGHSSFEMGGLSAAQQIVESHIDPDYPPLRQLRKRRDTDKLAWVVTKVVPAGGLS